MLDTPNSPEAQAAAEHNQHPNSSSRAWGEIPEAFVRDPSVGEAELVLTAYRATFTKGYVMRERVLRASALVRGVGLGKNAIRRTIAAMKARGTIRREVPRRGAEVEERLALDALATGYLRVWRWWFSAVLTLKAMAAWLFLQAGTGKGPVVWGREIRARFGWDPKTCGKVVGELDTFGLLSANVDRNKGGAYRGVGYQAKVWEKRGNQKPGMGKTGQHTKDSLLRITSQTNPCLTVRVLTSEESALRANFSSGKLADWQCQVFLKRLTSGDLGKALAPKLRRNARGLGSFLQAMARDNNITPERVVEIIEVRLTSYRVIGKPVEAEAEMNYFADPTEIYDAAAPRWIETWGYFARHIAEEADRSRLIERAS